jgi:Flp pilus assembly protein TadD
LGQVLAAQGKLGESVHYFREATRLRHEDAEVHESLGRALAELGKKDEAAVHLREALRILRSTPAAR